MQIDRQSRLDYLRGVAPDYVAMSLRNITREYPVMPWFIETGPGTAPSHREAHPAFYGCFDWHSCVELHWVIVRLLRLFPDETGSLGARETLRSLLTEANLAQELAFFDRPMFAGFERPYGWGWFLTLHHEVSGWDDPDAQRWHALLTPLAERFAAGLITWLPKLTYPHRYGVHSNTAFSLSRALDFAIRREEQGNCDLLKAIRVNALRFYQADEDYPARIEPSGSDFLSPSLTEAELMSRLLEPDHFSQWLTAFLPGLSTGSPATLFTPAVVSDATDGHIAHLHGLNLSRAWAFFAIAERLPKGDDRIPTLLESAARHAEASLDQVVGSDYMVEHWLAVYAMLLLS